MADAPKDFHINPATGNWDDNYWANTGSKLAAAANGGGGSGAPQISTIWDNPEKLNQYLADYQKNVLGQFGITDATDANGNVSYDKIASALTPNTDMPAPLNRVELFGQYRTAYGVDQLEADVTDLKNQQRALDAQVRVNVSAERGKPVAQNVIEGRVSEQQRAGQEEYDFLSRQIAYKTDQLNSAYNVIGMYMNFQQLDYTDAVDRYNQEFTQNMSVFGMLRGIRQDAISEAGQQTDVQFQKANLDLQYQDAARANLQIMANAITSGNIDPASLSDDQKLQLNKLELQSGLPLGFVSNLGLSAKDRILTTSTNNGVTTVVYTDAAGNLSTKQVGTPTGGSGSATAAQKKALDADVSSKMTLDQIMKKYGNSLSPDTILSSYNSLSPWGKAKESAETLAKKYNVSTTPQKSTITNTEINKAKQLLLTNGGTDSDLKKAETDPNFANWVIANYGN